MNVIVYGNRTCVMCDYTKRWMERLDIEFEYRDVEVNETWHDEAKTIAAEYNLLQNYPIVVVGNKYRRDAWSGFKIEKIKSLRETGEY